MAQPRMAAGECRASAVEVELSGSHFQGSVRGVGVAAFRFSSHRKQRKQIEILRAELRSAHSGSASQKAARRTQGCVRSAPSGQPLSIHLLPPGPASDQTASASFRPHRLSGLHTWCWMTSPHFPHDKRGQWNWHSFWINSHLNN